MSPRFLSIQIPVLAAILILAAIPFTQAIDGSPLDVPGMSLPEPLRLALLQNSTDSGLKLLDELEQEQPARRDDWLFYRSVLLQRAEKFEQSIQALKVLEDQYPESPWFHKSRLRRSQLLTKLARYGEAQKILEEETQRLRSGERIEELARILLDVADRISAEPDEKLPDPPIPQYGRARDLYIQAAELVPPRLLLEESLWGLVRCSASMKNDRNQIIRDADRYTTHFDPRVSSQDAGEHLFAVLLARTRATRGVLARRGYQDLVNTIDASLAGEEPWGDQLQGDQVAMFQMIRGDALKEIVETYNYVDLKIAALRRFIEEAPDHPMRINAGFAIGGYLKDNAQSEAALDHWIDFINKEIPGDATLLEELKRQAQYQVGGLLFQMERYVDSRAAFVKYGQRAPDGPDWSRAQESIINIDARIGERYLDNFSWEEGREAIEQFAARYPLDSHTRPLLLRSALSHAHEAMELRGKRNIEDLSVEERDRATTLYEASISDLGRLIGKYPLSQEGIRARLEIGIILEESLLRLEEAVAAYRECFGLPLESAARARLRELTEKSLQIGTDGLIRSDSPASFSLDTRNIEKVEVRIYPLDIEAYFRKYHSRDQVERLDLDLIDPWKTIEVEVDEFAKYRPCHQRVDLPVEGSGTWAVLVASEKFQATTLVVRTDLDIIVKAGRREVLVFAQDMLQGKPAAGVDVLIAIKDRFGNDDHQELQEVKTGSDGTVHIRYEDLKDSDDVKVLAMRDGDSAVTGLRLNGTILTTGRSPRVNFLTDRATYRPGDTVHWRAVVREVDSDTGLWLNPRGKEGQATLVTPGGIEVLTSRSIFSDAGTLSDSFVLPFEAPHGTWTIQVTGSKDATGQHHFIVEDIAPLKIDLRIESEQLVHVRGETIQATITAQTWYGEPLAGTPVVVHFNDGHTENFTLDEKGQAKIQQDTRDELGSEVTLTVTVPEYGLSRSTSVMIAESMWQLALQIPRESGDYIIGESVPISITATDASGQPVERDVKVRLVQNLRSGGRWVENTIETRELRTDTDGHGEARIPLDDSGNYSIIAEGIDRIGNRITSRLAVKVSGEDEERGLIWLVERTTIDVGEKVALDLQNTRSSSPALLTIIGDGILEYRIIDLEADRNSIEIDVLSSMYPEATVQLSMMETSRLYEAQIVFRVRKQLILEVIAPTEAVEPGSEVTLDVISRNLQGKPISAEIALAVIDVAVDDLYPDYFQDLKGDISRRNRSSHIVTSATSCGFKYQGETIEISRALLEEDEYAREEMELMERRMSLGTLLVSGRVQAPASDASYAFNYQSGLMDAETILLGGGSGGVYGQRFGRSRLTSMGGLAALSKNKAGETLGEEMPSLTNNNFTAHWEGALMTGPDGTARITFIAPPHSTTWRIRAQAIGDDDLFGNSTGSFIARNDISVDPILPSSAMEGDRIEPRVRIVNTSGTRGRATVTIRIGGGDGAFEVSSDLVLNEGMQELTLGEIGPLPADPELPVEITLKIDGEAGMRTIRQVRTITVRPWGLMASGRAGGSLDISATRTIRLPGSSQWLDRTLSLWIGSSLSQVLVDLAADSTPGHRIQFGNDLASRAARLRGSISVLTMGRRSGKEIAPQKLDQIRSKIRGLIGHLSMTQNPDGGWGWRGGKSTPRTSAEVLIALGKAKTAGFTVPQSVLGKAIPAVERMFRSAAASRDDLKAHLLDALSVCGVGDFAAANRLHRSRDRLSSSTLTHLISSLVVMKRLPMASEAASMLLSRRNPDGSWSPSPERKDASNHDYWYRDPLVMTAMAVESCSLAGRPLSDLETSIQWLEDRRPWNHGLGSGLALAALATVDVESASAATDCEIEFFIDGEPTKLMSVNPNRPSATAFFELGDGKGDLEIRLVARGAGKPHWAALLSARTTDYPKVVENSFAPRPTRYLRSAPRQDGQEVGIGFSVTRDRKNQWLNHVKKLRLGDSTEVSFSIHDRPGGNSNGQRRRDPEHLQLDLIIPAGMSLVDGSLKGRFDSHRLDGNSLQIWTRINGGFNISYSLVGTVPGQYRVPPPVIRSVSVPSRISIGEATTLTVLSRGRPTDDEYRQTPDETYNRGRMHWEAKRWREARELLTGLWEQYDDQLRPGIRKEVARILLLSAIEAGDNSAMVSFFEVLKEQNPDLNIEFDKVIRIGEAYRILGEHPRSIQIFLAVIQETFGRDIRVPGVLEDRDLKASLQLLLRLVMEYPDLPPVLAADQTLADLALSRADDARRASWGLSPAELSFFGIELLRRFLYTHGDDPTAPDAGLNLVSAFLDLEDWRRAADESGTLAMVFKDSRHLDSFRYTRAVALWSLDQEQEALQLLQQIVDARYETPSGNTRTSENRDLALYIIGQIHHAANQTEAASKYYEQVVDYFEDARASLARFRSRELELDEISDFRPGDPVNIELRYRNIDEAEVLAYKVNLMTLALREQDLSRVTEVNLSGIAPTISTTVELGKIGPGGGAMQATQEVTLPIEDVGAYLIIVRGGDVHTSGLVLINQMELVVETLSGTLRIQSIDPVTDELIPDVQVRVLAQGDVHSGTTDRRGLFISDGANFMPTVIARRNSSDYAFFRAPGGQIIREAQQQTEGAPAQQMEIQDYLQNVIQSNDFNRTARDGAWRSELKKTRKGIQIKQASD
ncbi:MAG: hypothetical protein DSY81_09965 [Bacillota bacterium]|nr:MAG: hypothetical protein DSY92_07640 [Planctomycetota bacterium]RUA08241.1 MAG: hypothetical protein DSY81_09965 [Bacillota bacterium]